MITPCTTSTVDSFQVLDPTPVVPPGSVIGQYYESGTSQLSVGIKVYNITFGTVKIATSYIFDSSVIRNLVDDPAPQFSFTITNQSTTGFQVVLDAEPTTVNSFLYWAVRIVT